MSLLFLGDPSDGTTPAKFALCRSGKGCLMSGAQADRPVALTLFYGVPPHQAKPTGLIGQKLASGSSGNQGQGLPRVVSPFWRPRRTDLCARSELEYGPFINVAPETFIRSSATWPFVAHCRPGVMFEHICSICKYPYRHKGFIIRADSKPAKQRGRFVV